MDVMKMLSDDKFLDEKNNALTAGGPLDKSELRIASFDIAAAFAAAA